MLEVSVISLFFRWPFNIKLKSNNILCYHQDVGMSLDELVPYFQNGFECEKTTGVWNINSITPLSNKQVTYPLFDADKISNDLYWMSQIIVNDFEETTDSLRGLETSVNGSASYESKLSGLSLQGSFGLSTDQETKSFYHYRYNRHSYGFVTLRNPSLDYLTDEAREELDAITSMYAATKFLQKWGLGYINQVEIGRSYKKTCKMESYHFLTKSDLSMEIENKTADASIEGTVDIDMEICGRNVSSSVEVERYGGPKDFVGTWEEFLAAPGSDPAVIAYDFEPLYSMCNGHPAQIYLEDAYRDMIERAPSLPGVEATFSDRYIVEVQRRKLNKDYIRIKYDGGSNLTTNEVTDKARKDFLKKVNAQSKEKNWGFHPRVGSTLARTFECDHVIRVYTDVPANIF